MTDLSELMSRDPLTFTKEGGEIAKIVERLRSARGQYNLGSMKAGKVSPPKTAAGKAVAELGAKPGGLSLRLGSLIAGDKK